MGRTPAISNSRRWRYAALLALVGGLSTVSSHAQVIFQDNFESGNLSLRQNNFRWGEQTATGVSNERAKGGSYALKFTFAGVPAGQDSFSEQRFYLGGFYPEVWMKYDFYVPANYVHRSDSGSNNNKGFLYLWDGEYGSPAGPGMGPNLWPVSGSNGLASNASHYIWGRGLDKHFWSAAPKAIEAADRGKWVEIVVHYKYATSANNNGVAEVWKTRDGVREKIMSITNGDWYVSGQPGFDRGYLLGWANSGFNETTVFYMDNVVFSTQSLLGAVGPVPSAPTNVSVQ